MIRLLIVDDSVTAQRFLTEALAAEPDFEVVGSAATGVEAVALAERLRPTLITMDLQMPDMDGLQATEEIMAASPTRIVIVSAKVGSPDQQVAFNALRAGALEVVPKAILSDAASLDRYRALLISTLRAMAGVTVLRRRRGSSGQYLRPAPAADRPPTGLTATGPDASWPSRQPLAADGGSARGWRSVEPVLEPAEANAPTLRLSSRRHRFLAIGASTGGPQVLGQLAATLPPDLPFPIAVVQHMSPGFTLGFTRWLAGESRMPVKQAEDGEVPQAGRIYVAPDGVHLRLAREGTFALGAQPDGNSFRPSVDVLFASVASVYGSAAVGLLLTGMGQDGARGMLELRRAGAWTLAQTAESCVVNGMPQAAADLGAVEAFASPSQIPELLINAVARR